MATLHAGSKARNLRSSVAEYARGKLEVQAGLNLDWGQPGFKEEGLERWVQFRMVLSTGRFLRQVDNGDRLGELRDAFLVFNLFERYPQRRNVYHIEAMRRECLEYFLHKEIVIKDASSGYSQAGTFRVEEISHDNEMNDGRRSLIRQWNITMRGRYLFRWSP